MTGGDQILEEIFPQGKIPEGLRPLLPAGRFSRRDLLAASPSRLADPFSLPGLEETLRRLEGDLSAGRTLNLSLDGSGDAVAAASLLRAVFRPHRRRIRSEGEPDSEDTPTLELAGPAGLRYRGNGRTILLSPAAPDGTRYSAAGLVFKLGEGRQRTAEKGFGQEYVAFDLETTGRDPRRDEIIEIGAVRISGGRLGEESSALVKPTRPLPKLITEITGITDRDLEHAPPISEVLPKFLDFIGASTLIAHNVEFDFAFLRRAARRHLQRKLTNRTFCTLMAARARMPGQGHRLGEVARALGIELKDWHRATADARAAAEIFLRFREEDNAPKRYGYFRKALGRACLGTLLAGWPVAGDNAVFLRHGLGNLLAEYSAGESYFRRHPERAAVTDRDLISWLGSRWKRKRGRAVYRLVERTRGNLPGGIPE